MASQRKRKYGSITGPSEDELNKSIKKHNESIEQGTSTSEDDNDEDFNDNNDTVVFHDLIHGHFELPRVLLKIVDTPQFQRLRFISQMGEASYVYMGACHTRFQHCLGVAYLAGKLCKVLRKRQPELGITTKDVLCIQIAGLCHDIGHGPFSKLFDNSFLPSIRPGVKWTHEDGSIDMFDHMWKENNLDSIFCDNFFSAQDIIFIKELILGSPSEDDDSPSQGWLYKGRSKEKSFLYQIVCNKTSGVDVDKWDYLARDSFHLGFPNSFNYKRFLKFARVISCDGTLQICMRDKDAGTLYEMFHMRTVLQRHVISHKTSQIAKFMLTEALVKANDYILIPGTNGKMFKMADCIHDMNAYTKLTDDVLGLIQTSQDENLKEAQNVLQRLHERNLYKLIGQGILPHNVDKSENTFRDEICNTMDVIADKDDFIVTILKFNYGMKDTNPVDNVRFYRKDNPDVGIQLKKEQISLMLPQVCSEQHIRLYCKKNDHFLVQNASIAFKQWYDSNFSNSVTNSCDDEAAQNGN